MVAAANVGQHGVIVVGQTRRDVLVVAPPGPGLVRGGQEDFHRRIGQYHRSDVPALDDHVARAIGHLALQTDKPGAHRGHRRHGRDRLGDLVAADF